jgi:hypothetical protein
MDNKLSQLIENLINKSTKGVDVYRNNGSLWLIFTDEKRWVIELTKDGTLWYNFYFFKNIFKLLSLEVVDHQHHITKWVEDTFINNVEETSPSIPRNVPSIDKVIENGVKETLHYDHHCLREVVGTIQNGVNHTRRNGDSMNTDAEDAIENGVKHTMWSNDYDDVEDTIKNGIINTFDVQVRLGFQVEDTIQNGVKDTKNSLDERPLLVENITQNRVKETKHTHTHPKYIEDTIQNGMKKTKRSYESSRRRRTEDTIQNGVKETKLTTSPFTTYVEDAIQNGVKHTRVGILSPGQRVDDTIQNGVKETKQEPSQRTWMSGIVVDNGIKETKHGVHFFEDTTENVIKDGEKIIKETYHDEYHHNARIGGVIKNGVKETKTPGEDGDILSTLEWIRENNTVNIPELINDVIKDGVKLTITNLSLSEDDGQITEIEDVITNGIKETKKLEHDRTTYHGYFSQERGTHTPLDTVQDVVKNGIKETQPHVLRIYNPMTFEPVFKEEKRMNQVNDVLDKGIKEVQPLPAQDGNRDWGNYYYRKGEPTKPFTKYVDEVIAEGEKIR